MRVELWNERVTEPKLAAATTKAKFRDRCRWKRRAVHSHAGHQGSQSQWHHLPAAEALIRRERESRTGRSG